MARGDREAPASLLRESGDVFIESAYRVLLGRQPDPAGLANFRGRLSEGVSKSRILQEIAGSPEGIAKGVDLSGLRGTLALARMANLPLVGGALGALFRIEGDAPADRKIRALEHQLSALMDATMPRLRILRRGLGALRQSAAAAGETSRSQSWVEEREQLLAEHSADRKVWSIEQAEAKKYIAALEEHFAEAETYAKSLEQERAHWRSVHETELGLRKEEQEAAARRIGLLEEELACLRAASVTADK